MPTDTIGAATGGIQDSANLGPGIPETNQAARMPTFGEQLVGITFNPSNDDKVGKVKQLFAEIADIVNEHYSEGEGSLLKNMLFGHTIG